MRPLIRKWAKSWLLLRICLNRGYLVGGLAFVEEVLDVLDDGAHGLTGEVYLRGQELEAVHSLVLLVLDYLVLYFLNLLLRLQVAHDLVHQQRGDRADRVVYRTCLNGLALHWLYQTLY